MYMKLTKKYHPDVCRLVNAKEIFTKINEAYSILSNKELRQMFDKSRHRAQQASNQNNWSQDEAEN